MDHVHQDLREFGKASEAYWSTNPDGRIAIFVHGFGGDATTWREFESDLPNDPKAAGADVVFFGYEGIKGHIALSADLLYRFLDTVAKTPSRLSSPLVSRPAGFRYRSILIVAHSMGAIVSRRALLLGVKTRSSWVRRTKLVFFAPAHAGVRVTALVKQCGDLVTKIGVLSGFGKVVSPAYDDLSKPETFQKLMDETRAVLSTRYGPALRAKRIVFGATENIVLVQEFCEDPVSPDPEFVVIAGKNHTTVCKPTRSYRRPVEIVTEVL